MIDVRLINSLNDLPKTIAHRQGGSLSGFSLTRRPNGLWRLTFRIHKGQHFIAWFEDENIGTLFEYSVWFLENYTATLTINKFPPREPRYKRLQKD